MIGAIVLLVLTALGGTFAYTKGADLWEEGDFPAQEFFEGVAQDFEPLINSLSDNDSQEPIPQPGDGILPPPIDEERFAPPGGEEPEEEGTTIGFEPAMPAGPAPESPGGEEETSPRESGEPKIEITGTAVSSGGNCFVRDEPITFTFVVNNSGFPSNGIISMYPTQHHGTRGGSPLVSTTYRPESRDFYGVVGRSWSNLNITGRGMFQITGTVDADVEDRIGFNLLVNHNPSGGGGDNRTEHLVHTVNECYTPPQVCRLGAGTPMAGEVRDLGGGKVEYGYSGTYRGLGTYLTECSFTDGVTNAIETRYVPGTTLLTYSSANTTNSTSQHAFELACKCQGDGKGSQVRVRFDCPSVGPIQDNLFPVGAPHSAPEGYSGAADGSRVCVPTVLEGAFGLSSAGEGGGQVAGIRTSSFIKFFQDLFK